MYKVLGWGVLVEEYITSLELLITIHEVVK